MRAGPVLLRARVGQFYFGTLGQFSIGVDGAAGKSFVC